MPPGFILAIDAGTTGVTAILFDEEARPAHKFYREITQHYPRPGWVEHDPEEIWTVTRSHLQQAVETVGADAIAGIGITNQRETSIVWDRRSGAPIHRAIVWQCRRTAPECERLKSEGWADAIREKTGLVIDPYFSGTKAKWLLENVADAEARAASGDLLFGTVDTWILWRLTGGKTHATDFTNASRTMLFNIQKREWDRDILDALSVPEAMLPKVLPSAADFGTTDADEAGLEVPIAGVAGDQQSALFGQGGFHPGTAKNTYGTGCFFLLNMGDEFVQSSAGLITTLACGPTGEPTFALEGSVFIAGAVVQWLRDEMRLIKDAPDSEQVAAEVDDTGGVYVVPAFVGLGAPHWNADARGTIVGITRGTRPAHIVRAALESIAYQARDLIDAAHSDLAEPIAELRVDGGACANNLLMQFQSDLLGVPVNRPENIETTSLGAAFLAGLHLGLWQDAEVLEQHRRVDRIFHPTISPDHRAQSLAGWHAAIRKTLA